VNAKTPRERDYIAAIESHLRRNRKKFDREHSRPGLTKKAMGANFTSKYPDDREASAFYALALIATASPTDKTYANQKKAAGPSSTKSSLSSRTIRGVGALPHPRLRL